MWHGQRVRAMRCHSWHTREREGIMCWHCNDGLPVRFHHSVTSDCDEECATDVEEYEKQQAANVTANTEE